MIRTLDFNAFAAGTVIDDEYQATDGVLVSAVGGSGQAMTFDTNNPTGDDTDLASDTLDGVLIISEDGDSSDPDDNDAGGSIFFDFESPALIKELTFKDIEETEGEGTSMIFYDAEEAVIEEHFVQPTEDGGEHTVGLSVDGVSRLEVRFEGSGAVDNLVFDDKLPMDDGPTAIDDSGETDEDSAVIIDLRGNDTDPDDPREDLVIGDFVSADGTVTDLGDGTVSFLPTPDFNGETSFTYTVTDPDGNSDTGEVTVQVNPVNDAPVAVDDTDTTDLDTTVTVDLLANDSDVDGDTLSVTAATVPPEQGSLLNNGDGTVTFTPAAAFTGPATISYAISDGNGGEDSAVHVIDVTPEVLAPPVANDDTAATDEDTAVIVDLRGNDIDPDNTLDELTLSDLLVDPAEGTVVDNGDGTVTFTPAADFNGDATITYTLTDPDGASDDAEAIVTVAPVNDAPVAGDDVMGTPYNTPIEDIDVLANDTDVDGDPLRLVSATSPDGTVLITPEGMLSFTPTEGFTGPAEITYTISDRPEGDPEGLSDVGTLVVNVAAPDTRDGIVAGTIGADVIDSEYLGDPDGDRVDGEDAIIPGQAPNDDIIRAGDGDDTVVAGLGDDNITGGEGDDSILGEDGNDTVDGGAGDDVINTSGPDLAPDRGYPDAPTDSLGFEGDDDTENDRDSVIGGAGNDTITTGDDRDTIIGGTGADVIDAGIDDDFIDGDEDDDRIVGGEGSDTIFGGAGDDTIYAGNDPDGIGDLLDIPDDVTAGAPFSPDRNPDNGRDVVQGGAGEDLIFGADDADSLVGGSGNDTIDGQIDDDTISGGSGDDSLLGGQGDDTIEGGTGEDTLEGGIGDDTLRGNRNDDILLGGAGDDVLDGGGDDDLLDGGEGDDDLQGGLGDDTLRGGAGEDTMTGGAGQDVFAAVGAGDEIDGGSGPVDLDTLDLRGSAPEGGGLEVIYTSDDREDGVVNYFDADGADAGQLVFEEIENVIPCFTPGTKIATPKGERLVEELKVGERVITRDNGIQEIRWVGARDMSGAELEKAPHLRPVLIRQGALGNDLPERDMMVSPNHRVLVANDKTALYFEEREVLVAAKHLTDLEGVDIVEVSQTTYIHVMFDQHEVILSDGAWTESFQPGDMSLAGIGKEQRQEILELFPELATTAGIEGYASARRSLKKHEAKLITE